MLGCPFASASAMARRGVKPGKTEASSPASGVKSSLAPSMKEVRDVFLLLSGARIPSQWAPTMGQQSKKIIKRRRRADYVKRKKEQIKLGGIAKKSPVKKEEATKKAPAAKKVPAKKAPAKKIAKKVADEVEVDPAVEAAESPES